MRVCVSACVQLAPVSPTLQTLFIACVINDYLTGAPNPWNFFSMSIYWPKSIILVIIMILDPCEQNII